VLPAGSIYLGRVRNFSERFHLLVIGLGGIGHAFLAALAEHRVDALTLLDGDTVTANNLSRQPLFSEVDIGRWKVDVVRAALLRSRPSSVIHAYKDFGDVKNLPALIAGSSVVIDCTDDAHAKHAIDRVCLDARVPLISGAVHADQGQVILLHAFGAKGDPVIRRGHLFAGRSGPQQDTCDMRDVRLEVLSAIGMRMAEVLDDLRADRRVVNGRVELLHQGRWTAIAPPERFTSAWNPSS